MTTYKNCVATFKFSMQTINLENGNLMQSKIKILECLMLNYFFILTFVPFALHEILLLLYEDTMQLIILIHLKEIT